MRIKGLIAAVLLIFLCTGIGRGQTAEQVLPPDYVSDRCSMFPDGDWGHCCVEHDKKYFFGGTKAQRRAADRQLADCVRSSGPRRKMLANVIYLGVRVGGVAFLPTPFRWGFGRSRVTNY